MVLLAILVTEWVQTYLPQMAHLVEWSLHKILPRRMLVSPPSIGKRGGDNVEYDGLDIAQAATKRATASRTGTSRNKRRALTRKADAQALQQLQQISSAGSGTAKYRHVSVSFLKRHGLGPYQPQQQQHERQADRDDVEMQEKEEQSTLSKIDDKASLNDSEDVEDEDDDAECRGDRQ